MLALVGFDGDDTLWRSEEYYRQASEDFGRILAQYLDLHDADVQRRMLETERRNLALFGYGAKGMTLSMVETAIALTDARISAAHVHRIVAIGKRVLQHPVELLPDIRAAVEQVAAQHPLVLITKGDLFHQENKVAHSGIAELFARVEIVSEKDPRSYARILAACRVDAGRFAMVGNSLRSDIEPVLHLGGWGVHLPYHVTWAHELENGVDPAAPRLFTIERAAQIPATIARLDALAHETKHA